MKLESSPLNPSAQVNGHSRNLRTIQGGQSRTASLPRSIDELQKRADEARLRFLITEIDMAAELLSKIERSPDPKDRIRSLREAGAILQLASRVVASEPNSDSRSHEIPDRIQQLQEQFQQLSEIQPESYRCA